MKQIKFIQLFCIGLLLMASDSYGQANPFINVLPTNSGVVTVGGTIDIIVTIGNTGPISSIPQAKLRPIIQVPPSVTFLPNAQQTGLPTGWSILTNTGSQLRVCNSTDAIAVNTTRTIILKAQGVVAALPQPFAGNINFGNGTTCAAGPSVLGDNITDNGSTSTIKVLPKLNLTAWVEGYYDVALAEMRTPLFTSGTTLNSTDCDTLTVELHTAASTVGAPIIAETFKGILNKNGTISCSFPVSVVGNSYYIVIYTHNSVKTWSANTVSMSSVTNYDFSSGAGQAFGSNMIEVATGRWAIYSADLDKLNGVDLNDFTLWQTDFDNFASGWLPTDIDGDGSIGLTDFTIWQANFDAFIGEVGP